MIGRAVTNPVIPSAAKNLVTTRLRWSTKILRFAQDDNNSNGDRSMTKTQIRRHTVLKGLGGVTIGQACSKSHSFKYRMPLRNSVFPHFSVERSGFQSQQAGGTIESIDLSIAVLQCLQNRLAFDFCKR